jgi:hypothetical protein
MGPVFVIPAKAGIQLFQWVLDSGFHRSDDSWTFYENILFFGMYHVLVILKKIVTPVKNGTEPIPLPVSSTGQALAFP